MIRLAFMLAVAGLIAGAVLLVGELPPQRRLIIAVIVAAANVVGYVENDLRSRR